MVKSFKNCIIVIFFGKILNRLILVHKLCIISVYNYHILYKAPDVVGVRVYGILCMLMRVLYNKYTYKV